MAAQSEETEAYVILDCNEKFVFISKLEQASQGAFFHKVSKEELGRSVCCDTGGNDDPDTAMRRTKATVLFCENCVSFNAPSAA
jgi:hypothetical protein